MMGEGWSEDISLRESFQLFPHDIEIGIGASIRPIPPTPRSLPMNAAMVAPTVARFASEALSIRKRTEVRGAPSPKGSPGASSKGVGVVT